MLEILNSLLLATHLLAMNLASAGPLVCLWLRWSSHSFDQQSGRWLAWWSVVAFLVGMAIGGLLILTMSGSGLSAALQRFPANAYWFAGAELLFSLVLMIVIAVGWEKLNKFLISLFAFATATNLLYHFPPMMAVIGQLSSNAQWASEALIDRPAMRGLMARGEVMALAFHFAMSSFAVAGIALLQIVAAYGDDNATETKRVARMGAGMALAATLLQIPIGLWLLVSLPTPNRMALMGGSIWASLAFLAAIVTSIGLLQRLVTIALGETDRKNLKPVIHMLCTVIVLMTISMRLSRPTAEVLPMEIKTASSQKAQG